MSKVTHPLVCIVLTQCFCFASSVCFSSFKNLILSGFVRDWCCFPSRRLLYTSICLSIFFLRLMFAFMTVYSSLCWLCSLSDILATHDSNIDSCALSLLTILHVVYATMVHIWHYFISWRYLVRYPTNAIALHVVLLRYCEKDNLCSLFRLRQKLTMPSPRVQLWVWGAVWAPFPNSGW